MNTYEVYANNHSNGTIKTENIKQFIEDNYKYKSLRYEINEEENEVYLYFDILDVMRIVSN